MKKYQAMLLLLAYWSTNTAAMAEQDSPHAAANPHAGYSVDAGATAPLWSEAEKAAQEKEASLLQAIKDDPDNGANYTNLAHLYLLTNKTEKAIPAYQEAIIHDGSNPKLFAALSIAYLHQSKYSMAKAMAEQALSLDPEMQQAKKLQEYIVAKEEVIQQASRVSVMPQDENHQQAPGH